MKNIKFTIFAPVKGLNEGRIYQVKVKDDARFIESLAMVDKIVLEDPKNSPFPLYDGYIKTYLQLFWNPQKNEIYDDCAVNAYGPNRQFMPLRDDLDFNLYPDSEIKIHPDAGC